MSDRHAPREAFVAELESRLRADLARQRVAVPVAPWLPQSPRGLALAAAAVIVVSMVIGGGVVAATYEAQQNAQRDMIVTLLEQRGELARRRLELAKQQLRDVESRIAVGVEPPKAAGDARLKVLEAETEVRLVELDIREARRSGREPNRTVSAPKVDGQDFVAERWQVEAQLPAMALDVAKAQLDAARTRFAAGLANKNDIDTATGRIVELEGAVRLAQQKMAIRRAFLNGDFSAADADLQVMMAETEQRRHSLAQRIDLARGDLQELRARAQVGTANNVDVAEAELRLQELQLALSKADYELALIRKQVRKK